MKDATGNLGRVTARLACGRTSASCRATTKPLGFTRWGQGLHLGHCQRRPALCAQFQNACASGDWGTALALQDRLYPLHDALFSDASPGPGQICAFACEAGNPGGGAPAHHLAVRIQPHRGRPRWKSRVWFDGKRTYIGLPR